MAEKMMNNMMPGGMMNGFPLFWVIIGVLLLFALVAAFMWFLASYKASALRHTARPQDSYQTYERGYMPHQPISETYQEGGQQYPYLEAADEQPQARYPQEMPLQH
jgi:flagellar basal body-associated protein FliL